jgi:methylated-DNA-[protein]-cysteine S-methyltransferase
VRGGTTKPTRPLDDRWKEVELGGVLGRSLLVASPEGLVALRAWGELPNADSLSSWLARVAAPGAVEGPIAEDLVAALRAYSAGEAVEPAELPVELRRSAFHAEVYRALRRVPRGAVRTYQGLARDAGAPRAMRAVGQAMAQNPLPIVVPCHRVVAAGGVLGGYTGGAARKRALLALEGVSVEADRVLAGQLSLL